MIKIRFTLIMVLILLFQILLFSIEAEFYYAIRNNQDPINPSTHWSNQFIRDIKNFFNPVVVMPSVISSPNIINSDPLVITQFHPKPETPQNTNKINNNLCCGKKK